MPTELHKKCFESKIHENHKKRMLADPTKKADHAEGFNMCPDHPERLRRGKKGAVYRRWAVGGSDQGKKRPKSDKISRIRSRLNQHHWNRCAILQAK